MFLKLYLVALPIFLVIDLIWLGLVAKNFYRDQLDALLRSDVQWVPAIIFYLLFIVGLIVFVVMPALERGEWMHALLFGALFGLIAYATYDLTNMATLKDWPLVVTLVDLVWGAAIAASVSVATYFVAAWLGW